MGCLFVLCIIYTCGTWLQQTAAVCSCFSAGGDCVPTDIPVYPKLLSNLPKLWLKVDFANMSATIGCIWILYLLTFVGYYMMVFRIIERLFIISLKKTT